MVARLRAQDILAIHELVLAEGGGGAPGVRDLGLLESALGRMDAGFGGESFYPGLLDKAAAMLEALIQNHPFIDGNKRTALVAAATLLEYNGLELTYSPEDAVALTVGIAQHEVGLREVVAWLRGHAR
jgi:death-on-curing protein